jgi:hypothetical protein
MTALDLCASDFVTSSMAELPSHRTSWLMHGSCPARWRGAGAVPEPAYSVGHDPEHTRNDLRCERRHNGVVRGGRVNSVACNGGLRSRVRTGCTLLRGERMPHMCHTPGAFTVNGGNSRSPRRRTSGSSADAPARTASPRPTLITALDYRHIPAERTHAHRTSIRAERPRRRTDPPLCAATTVEVRARFPRRTAAMRAVVKPWLITLRGTCESPQRLPDEVSPAVAPPRPGPCAGEHPR